jgi:hypothetical protein
MFQHALITGRQILAAADLTPADEYVLLLRRRDGMLTPINLEDEIDIRVHHPERFYAFHSDRVVYFDMDGRRYPWGELAIPEATLMFPRITEFGWSVKARKTCQLREAARWICPASTFTGSIPAPRKQRLV